MTAQRDSYNPLSPEVVLSVLGVDRAGPVYDSWFGVGYTFSVGEQTTPLSVAIFPEGRIVSVQSRLARFEFGEVTSVIQHKDRLRIESQIDGEQVIVELSANGDMSYTRQLAHETVMPSLPSVELNLCDHDVQGESATVVGVIPEPV